MAPSSVIRPWVGAHPEQTAVARGHAHRAPAICADREIHEPAPDRGGGAARRAARNPIGIGGVDRRSVVDVLAGEAVGELVGQRLPRHAGTGLEQPSHDEGGLLGGRVGAQPVGIAEPGNVIGDVKHVFGGEHEPV